MIFGSVVWKCPEEQVTVEPCAGGPAAPGLPALHRATGTDGGGFAVKGQTPGLQSVQLGFWVAPKANKVGR